MSWSEWAAIGALVVSVISLWFARRSLQESHRPVVTAYVDELDVAEQATTFLLFVVNTGTRPALNVRLHASKALIGRLVNSSADPRRLRIIEKIFEDGSAIPVLRNGESLSTSFGAFTAGEGNTPWLNYGQQISIKISYEGIYGELFVQNLILKIYARHGFGGGIWGERRPDQATQSPSVAR